MAIGGYQIINLKGLNFLSAGGGTPRKVEGTWDKIEGTNKAFLVENYSIDGKEQKAEFVHFVYASNKFTALLHGSSSMGEYYISVDNDDKVTISLT